MQVVPSRENKAGLVVVVLPGGPILRRLGRGMLEFGRTPRGLFTDLDDEPFFRRTKFTGVTLVGDNLVLERTKRDLNLCSHFVVYGSCIGKLTSESTKGKM